MSSERFILHLNVADFAVAIERVVDRSLHRRPVIVAPFQGARAVVHDMSDEAYRDGVRKGMPLRQAVRYCRSARVLAPRFDLYERAMTAFAFEARKYTPLLEYGMEDGHLFLDITGTHRLFGAPPDVGWRLRKQVSAKIGIEPIWSLGSSKLVAKVASRLVKPVGEYIVAPGEEEAFLAPVPLVLFPGLSREERVRLDEFNIRLAGHLAQLTRKELCSVFGRRGDVLYELSRGIDADPVTPIPEKDMISSAYVLVDDSGDKRVVDGIISALAARIGMELRDRGKGGLRLALQLDYTDGRRVVRQALSRRPVSDDRSLRSLALLALKRAWGRRTRVRSCRLWCDRIACLSPQLDLFNDVRNELRASEALSLALDKVRKKFGVDSIRFGRQAALNESVC